MEDSAAKISERQSLVPHLMSTSWSCTPLSYSPGMKRANLFDAHKVREFSFSSKRHPVGRVVASMPVAWPAATLGSWHTSRHAGLLGTSALELADIPGCPCRLSHSAVLGSPVKIMIHVVTYRSSRYNQKN